jgi:hypothetical protein
MKLTLEDKQRVAEEIVDGPISWEDDDKGYFTCPLASLHTSPTKDNHSVIYFDDVPTFFCWHTSCLEWYENANIVLRQSCDDRSPAERLAGKQQRKDRQAAYYHALRIKSEREEIYANYNWDAIFESPLSSSDSWAAFLDLWLPDDVIWMGDVYDTGAERGGTHFRRIEDWHTNPINLRGSRFTCASTFLPSTVDRTNKTVNETKYLVVEFDSLDQDKRENRRKGAALLNYLRQSLCLRMVVDSGNKSLHGWFEMNEKITEQQRFFLRQLGADINAMRPSQPVRLPGAIRDNGNVQSILWVR